MERGLTEALTSRRLREHCQQLEIDLHYLVNDIAEYDAHVIFDRARMRTTRALLGAWRLRGATEVLRGIYSFLFAGRVAWPRYPPLVSLPMDPVMPYDHMHFFANLFRAVRRPTLSEYILRLRARLVSLQREHHELSRDAARALLRRLEAERRCDAYCQSVGF